MVLLNNRMGSSNDGIKWFAEIGYLETVSKRASWNFCVVFASEHYFLLANFTAIMLAHTVGMDVTDQNLYWRSVQSVRALVESLKISSFRLLLVMMIFVCLHGNASQVEMSCTKEVKRGIGSLFSMQWLQPPFWQSHVQGELLNLWLVSARAAHISVVMHIPCTNVNMCVTFVNAKKRQY